MEFLSKVGEWLLIALILILPAFVTVGALLLVQKLTDDEWTIF